MAKTCARPSRLPRWGQIAFMVFAAALPLAAQEQVYVRRASPQREGRAWTENAECGGAARDGGRLVLRSDLGSVRVLTQTGGRVICRVRIRAFTPNLEQAQRLLREYKIGAHDLEEGSLMITGELPPEYHWHRSLSVHFDITIPKDYNLDLETNAGDLMIGDLNGQLRGDTAGGDVRVGDVSGPVHVETKGGDIDLGLVGGRLEARTAGGSIHAREVNGDAVMETSGGEITAGTIGGSVSATTAGGDIVLRGAKGPVRAETAGGQIRIGACGSSVRVENAGGSIRVQGARGLVEAETAGGSIDLFRLENAVRAETSAGRIFAEISANRQTFSASRLETSVGDVFVFIPTDLPVSVDAAIEQAFGHRIVTDFPNLRWVASPEQMPGRVVRLEGPLNGGGRILRIRTVMGDIEIHRDNSPLLEEMRQHQQAFWNQWQQYWATHTKVTEPKEEEPK
jgi:DUF4097 and DUF4098 domain-containing protein YvlB